MILTAFFKNLRASFSATKSARGILYVSAAGLLTAATAKAAEPRLRVYVLDKFTASLTQTAASGPLSAARGGSGEAGAGAARAYADFGVLKVFAEAHAANTGDRTGLINDGAQAEFQDVLTIDAPGRTGTRGTLTVRFTIDGSLTCSGGWDGSRESSADAEFIFSSEGWTIREGYYAVYFNGRTEGNNFLGKEQVCDVGFTFGTPFTIKLYVTTVASAYNFLGADAVGDLENTATWGGFVSVKDSSGAEVAGYTAASASGADYRAAIAPPGPRLTIGALTQNALQISWTTNFGSYQLEAAESILGNWTPVATAPAQSGTNLTVTTPVTGAKRFLRLKRQ